MSRMERAAPMGDGGIGNVEGDGSGRCQPQPLRKSSPRREDDPYVVDLRCCSTTEQVSDDPAAMRLPKIHVGSDW